jgi:hypothetical protein
MNNMAQVVLNQHGVLNQILGWMKQKKKLFSWNLELNRLELERGKWLLQRLAARQLLEKGNPEQKRLLARRLLGQGKPRLKQLIARQLLELGNPRQELERLARGE